VEGRNLVGLCRSVLLLLLLFSANCLLALLVCDVHAVLTNFPAKSSEAMVCNHGPPPPYGRRSPHGELASMYFLASLGNTPPVPPGKSNFRGCLGSGTDSRLKISSARVDTFPYGSLTVVTGDGSGWPIHGSRIGWGGNKARGGG
jgi:hypothetical protein